MNIKIKKLNDKAVIPKYAKDGDAGLDLVATSKDFFYEGVSYGTGLSIEIPEGYVGLIFPRSSIYKTALILNNSVAVIDSGFRGELILKFRLVDKSAITYNIGDKIGQLIIIPHPNINLIEADNLKFSERGTGGFGSTGK